MKWLIGIVLTCCLCLGCIFGPDDGYITGSVATFLYLPHESPYYTYFDGVVVALDHPLEYGMDLGEFYTYPPRGGTWNTYEIIVKGDKSYYVYAVEDYNKNLRRVSPHTK